MALNKNVLKAEIINQMKRFKSLSKVKDNNGKDVDIDLELVIGDFAMALASAVVKHITESATVNIDSKTVS